MSQSGNLNLNMLDRGLPGITPSWGCFLSEASATCLISQNHQLGVEMDVLGSQKTQFKISLPYMSSEDWQGKKEDGLKVHRMFQGVFDPIETQTEETFITTITAINQG